jgi:hypothetical protein
MKKRKRKPFCGGEDTLGEYVGPGSVHYRGQPKGQWVIKHIRKRRKAK